MIKLCNPKLRLYNNCNSKFKNNLCENHLNSNVDFITYYIDIDPFIIENNIINFQYYWRNRVIIKKNRLIIKNIKKLVNRNDPITQENLIINNILSIDLDYIYPLFINNMMYIYKLESLLQILTHDNIEIFTKTEIKDIDIQKIKYLCKKLNINAEEDNLTDNEIKYLEKINALQKFDILGTYFPVNLFDNLSNEKKKAIYNELKALWIAFCEDNGITDIELYNQKVKWSNKYNENNIEVILIDTINFLLNDNLDYNIKKMITYIIIGAFAYVDPLIKNIYRDIDFI